MALLAGMSWTYFSLVVSWRLVASRVVWFQRGVRESFSESVSQSGLMREGRSIHLHVPGACFLLLSDEELHETGSSNRVAGVSLRRVSEPQALGWASVAASLWFVSRVTP